MERALAAIHQANHGRVPITLEYGSHEGRVALFLRISQPMKELDRGFFHHHHLFAHFYARHVTKRCGRFIARTLGLLAAGRALPSRSTLGTSASRTHDREDDLRVSSGQERYHLRGPSGTRPCAVDSGIGPVLDNVRGGRNEAPASLRCALVAGKHRDLRGSPEGADIVSDESRHRAAKVYRIRANPGVERSGTER